jgi:hypothetical protein
MKYSAPLLALTLMMLVSGCEDRPAAGLCPAITILGDAARVSLFKQAASQDINDLQLEARMATLGGTCHYDGDDVIVAVEFDVEAVQGPNASITSSALPVFVAVTRLSESVSAKIVEDVQLTFEGGDRGAKALKKIDEIRIPLGDDVSAADYEVVVGFQLTYDQLQYNRRNKR